MTAQEILDKFHEDNKDIQVQSFADLDAYRAKLKQLQQDLLAADPTPLTQQNTRTYSDG